MPRRKNEQTGDNPAANRARTSTTTGQTTSGTRYDNTAETNLVPARMTTRSRAVSTTAAAQDRAPPSTTTTAPTTRRTREATTTETPPAAQTRGSRIPVPVSQSYAPVSTSTDLRSRIPVPSAAARTSAPPFSLTANRSAAARLRAPPLSTTTRVNRRSTVRFHEDPDSSNDPESEPEQHGLLADDDDFESGEEEMISIHSDASANLNVNNRNRNRYNTNNDSSNLTQSSDEIVSKLTHAITQSFSTLNNSNLNNENST